MRSGSLHKKKNHEAQSSANLILKDEIEKKIKKGIKEKKLKK
jgi:cbb3-type cytochrome oxidase subunit 3